MTKFKATDRAGLRVLDDAELNAVSGGYLNNCIRTTAFPTGPVPNPGLTFKDLFAKPTLGTYH
jgi:hypothetical protein